MLRLLLILALVSGLVPAFAETVELVVHYAQTGHVAHAVAGEQDLHQPGAEHGCGPTAHHCGCHASQPVLPGTSARLLSFVEPVLKSLPASEALHAGGVRDAPFRPPIRLA